MNLTENKQRSTLGITMQYNVRKNKMNDITYITFGNIKVQVHGCDSTLCIYKDKSVLCDFTNIQLLKTLKVNISDTDYDAMYKIAKDWLRNMNYKR